MANEFKYVMINAAFPVIFYGCFSHKAFHDLGKITSAGFVRIKSHNGSLEVETYGESQGLEMVPNAEDAAIIKLFLKLSGGIHD